MFVFVRGKIEKRQVKVGLSQLYTFYFFFDSFCSFVYFSLILSEIQCDFWGFDLYFWNRFMINDMAVIHNLFSLYIHVHNKRKFFIFDQNNRILCQIKIIWFPYSFQRLVRQYDKLCKKEKIRRLIIGHKFFHYLLYSHLCVFLIFYDVFFGRWHLKIKFFDLNLLLLVIWPAYNERCCGLSKIGIYDYYVLGPYLLLHQRALVFKFFIVKCKLQSMYRNFCY